MYKAFLIQMRGFQIKSYVGSGGEKKKKREEKKKKYNVHTTHPPLILHRLKFRVFYPKKKRKATRRGFLCCSEVKQTAKNISEASFQAGDLLGCAVT